MVLRQAVESHYTDLCTFAQKLDSYITGEKAPLDPLRSEPMWPAMKEHLARSSIWRNLSKWESLWQEIQRLDAGVRERLRHAVEAKVRAKLALTPAGDGLDPSIVDALAFHITVIARGESGPDKRADLKVTSTGGNAT